MTQKIGRYEIKSELGRGGMATVYKAYDPRFEREVALKVLPREMLHDAQFRVRFEREAKTIAALEHQAIVPVYDVGEEDGQPYFVMRCMTGGSLGDIIARGPISLSTTTKIMERLAPALDEAHFKGVVHRDLKPGNILFDRTGEPYISDFGIAKITQAQGATVTGGAIIGTPAYMSPEQAQGEQVDGRSDVYAMGVILYEMLTGTQPFQATTPMAIVVKHITDPIPHILDSNPSLPPAIETIIEKAMAKSPDDRFSSAGELCAALSAVAAGQSGADALKTASMTATKIVAAKTRLVAGKTRLSEPAVEKEGFHISMPVMLIGGFIGLCLVGVLLLGVLSITAVCPPSGGILPWCPASPFALPFLMAQPTQVAVVFTETAVVLPTSAPVEAATATSEPTETQAAVMTETPAPESSTPTVEAVPAAATIIGGADRVAFVNGNEISVMNVDGSDLKVVTNDKMPKTNLQWIPGSNTLIYIRGLSVVRLNLDTNQSDIILAFPFARLLDEFRISPDGKQVAISLNREMYVVPFDIDKLKSVGGRDGLIAMKGCLNSTGNTQAAIHLKDFRWSKNSKYVAWLFEGGGAAGRATEDIIRIVDISSCDPKKLNMMDEFPGTRFTPEGYSSKSILPDFDWDGKNLFLMNTFDRNNGWGFMYSYTEELHQGTQENPVSSTKSRCCYRDARWSPDSTHVIFAFQSKDKPNATVQFYYIPVNSIRAQFDPTPIPLPDGFYTDVRQAPQFALRIAQP